MKLTKEQVAERLAKKTMGVLRGVQPTEEFLRETFLRELTKMEAETEKAELATDTGSQGLFDY